MTDTPPDVEAAFTAMFRQLSPAARLRMTSEMFDTARRLMIANIRANHPDISDTELRVQVFVRTYGDDYSESERTRIVEQIRQPG